MLRSSIKIFFLAFALTLFVFPQSISARQKASDQLTLYASPDAAWVALVAKKFEEETGIKVAWVREGGGVIVQKLKAEKESPKADVWFGATWDSHAAAAKEGLLESFTPTNIKDLAPAFQDPIGNHVTTGLYAGALGFAVNEPLLKKMGKPIPKTWDDLLNPAYKGLVSMASPNTSGTAMIALSTLVKLKGEKEAFDYFKKLHNNISQYTQSGAAPGLMAGKGEIAIAIIFLQDATKYRLQGYPIKEVIPADGTGYEIGGLSLIKKGPNPEAGKKFMNWVLESRIQELGPVAGSYQIPSNTKTKRDKNIFYFDKIKPIVNIDIHWLMDNRDRLIKKWNEEVFTLAKQ